MRGASKYKKKHPKPDSEYNRVDMGRFINYLMNDGKKTTAERVFYRALREAGKMTKLDPVEVFETALQNTTPKLEIASRRVGGANYQVPIDVRPERKVFFSANWIIWTARKKKGSPMHLRLASEIVLASKNEGDAVRKKLETHRLAEANRAFASFVKKRN